MTMCLSFSVGDFKVTNSKISSDHFQTELASATSFRELYVNTKDEIQRRRLQTTDNKYSYSTIWTYDDYRYRKWAAIFLDVFYYSKNTDNILTTELLDKVHEIEQGIKSWTNYRNHSLLIRCYKPQCNAYKDVYIESPPGSLITYLYPETFETYNIYDGNGQHICCDVKSALRDYITNSDETDMDINTDFFDFDFNLVDVKSKYLAAVYPFGYMSPNETRADLEAFVISFKHYFNTLPKDITNDIGIAFSDSSGEIIDNEILEYFHSDLHLAVVSLILTFILAYCYIRSLFITLFGLIGVLSSFIPCFTIINMLYGDSFNFIGLISVWIILGIGCDDIFVFMSSYRRSSIYLSDVKRMSFAFREAGAAMLVTSVTTAFSFYSLCFSKISPVPEFGFLVGTLVIVNYLLVMTWFPAILQTYIWLNRWLKNRNCSINKCFLNKCHAIPMIETDSNAKNMNNLINDNSDDENENNQLNNNTDLLKAEFSKCTKIYFIVMRKYHLGIILITIVLIFSLLFGYYCSKVSIGKETIELLPENTNWGQLQIAMNNVDINRYDYVGGSYSNNGNSNTHGNIIIDRTKRPTYSPTMPTTPRPTNHPTHPTMPTTRRPTKFPTLPTTSTTYKPTHNPIKTTTLSPTFKPTIQPTNKPTNKPTKTESPTNNPIIITNKPTVTPITKNPTITGQTSAPTHSITMTPTVSPHKETQTLNPSTMQPTDSPSVNPSVTPSVYPSLQPTLSPLISRTNIPTVQPTLSPTYQLPLRTKFKCNNDFTPYMEIRTGDEFWCKIELYDINNTMTYLKPSQIAIIFTGGGINDIEGCDSFDWDSEYYIYNNNNNKWCYMNKMYWNMSQYDEISNYIYKYNAPNYRPPYRGWLQISAMIYFENNWHLIENKFNFTIVESYTDINTEIVSIHDSITIYLLFGTDSVTDYSTHCNENIEKGKINFNDNFNIYSSFSQNRAIDLCNELDKLREIDPIMYRTDDKQQKCLMREFKNHLNLSNINYPLTNKTEFNTLISDFIYRYHYTKWIGFIDNEYSSYNEWDASKTEITWIYQVVETEVDSELPASAMYEYYNKWENFINNFNKESIKLFNENNLNKNEFIGLQSSSSYIKMDVEITFLNGFIKSVGYTIIVCGIIMIIFTQNILLSFIVCLYIIIIVIWILGIFGVYGWEFGLIEIISVPTVVGLTIDYALHITHAYIHSPFYNFNDRINRSKSSINNLGSSIFCSAITTISSMFLLYFATILLFSNLGFVVSVTTSFGLFLAIFICPSLLMYCGPQNDKCQLRWFYKILLKICKRNNNINSKENVELVQVNGNDNVNNNNYVQVKPVTETNLVTM